MSQQSDRIMVDRISDIARECEVHPSAIVRFSQRFGFSGFSEMQALFREAYTHNHVDVVGIDHQVHGFLEGHIVQFVPVPGVVYCGGVSVGVESG